MTRDRLGERFRWPSEFRRGANSRSARSGFIFASVAAWAVILGMIVDVLWPILTVRQTIGGHDWDQMESHRYLVTKTILRFHQFPFWNPYACGGHTNWAGIESGTTIVSPWFPFYLALPLPAALRIEVLGSALVSALGAWLLAGRFTKSPAARAFLVVLFAVNGRWALQITAGHTWHLAYGLTPWTLYFYDRAVAADPRWGAPRMRFAVLAGVVLALMIYWGGIYPVPQTVVVVALYGTGLAIRLRSLRPVVLGLVSGGVALGLAAPKLFPMIDMLRRFPRLVESNETIDLAAFVAILTAPDQDMGSHPANIAPWGWHEYGMYVGWLVCFAVLAGLIFGRGLRESPLKWAGIVCFVLGFGAFDPHAPWPLLHQLPIFKSQHVPTRWQYPGILLLGLVTIAMAERLLKRAGWFRGAFELALLSFVWVVAKDVARVARQPITHMFANPMPPLADSLEPFRTEIHLPSKLNYAFDYAPPSLPAEVENFGTIDCSTFPGLNNWVRDKDGRAPGLGARGIGDPLYRGEVYIAEGRGSAAITAWTPNAVTVKVTGAAPGEHLLLNQNWDGGWTANGTAVLDWADQVAIRLTQPDSVVVFRYVPTFFGVGIGTLLATVILLGYAWSRRSAPSNSFAGCA